MFPKLILDNTMGQTFDVKCISKQNLNERQGSLQRMADCINLRPIQFREIRSREMSRQLTLENDVFDVVAEKSVVNVSGHRLLVNGEATQGRLHPERLCRF